MKMPFPLLPMQYFKKSVKASVLASIAMVPIATTATSLEERDSAKAEKNEFVIVAHRGASGYLPEHSLESTTLAYAQGPDFIEQDVVITKDNVPVVLHDIHLETVSNVEVFFPTRHRSDGRYYVRDFTLSELKTLALHERADSDGKQVFKARYSGTKAHFTIATLYEHFELISELNREFGQHIGVYPEVKSPAFHLNEGVDASKIVIDALLEYGFGGDSGNSFLQCFDFTEIKRIRSELDYKGKIVMLIGENSWKESGTDYDWLRSEEGMRVVAQYADGVGPWLGHVLDGKAMKQGEIKPASWLTHVYANNLTIHPYTYRHDALPAGMTGEALLQTLKKVVKADGVFTDQVPPVKEWRKND